MPGGERVPLVTVDAAARLYGRRPGTVRAWISEDGIPGQRDPALAGPGRRNVYPLDQLQAAYERRATQQEAASQ